MNQTATQEAKGPRQAGKSLTLNCGVHIRGASMLPEKLIAILDYHLLHIQKDTGLMSIVIRNDSRPTHKLGEAYPWAYAVSINLQGIFDKVWKKLSKQEWGLDLVSAVWLGLIETCLHEITHVHMAFTDEKDFEDYVLKADAESEEINEQLTKELAREFMIELFKQVDCSTPAVADMGYFAGLIQEVFIMQKDHKYIGITQQMLEKGVVYEDKEQSTYYRTLRDYIRNNLAAKDDEGWEDSVNLIKLSFVMEDGEVIEAEADPVVNAAEELPVAEAPIVAQVAMTTAAAGNDEEVEYLDAEYEVDENPDVAAVAAAFGAEIGNAVATAATQAGPIAPHVEAPASIPGIIPVNEAGRAVVATQLAQAARAVQPQTTVVKPATDLTPEQELAAKFGGQAQTATTLPELNISDENIRGCMHEIYLRMHSNIFLKCGWSPNQQGRWHFPEPYAVCASLNIGDILTRWGCEGLIHEYVSFAEGQEITPATRASNVYACTGMIQGFVYTDKGIPAYEIILNIHGNPIRRRLVVQNPGKMENNAYTKGADFAGIGGNRVSYVFKCETPQGRPFNENCSVKIVNEQAQVVS